MNIAEYVPRKTLKGEITNIFFICFDFMSRTSYEKLIGNTRVSDVK